LQVSWQADGVCCRHTRKEERRGGGGEGKRGRGGKREGEPVCSLDEIEDALDILGEGRGGRGCGGREERRREEGPRGCAERRRREWRTRRREGRGDVGGERERGKSVCGGSDLDEEKGQWEEDESGILERTSNLIARHIEVCLLMSPSPPCYTG
jgi:hypothetical protein